MPPRPGRPRCGRPSSSPRPLSTRLDCLPQVTVRGAGPAQRDVAEAAGGEVRRVPSPGLLVGARGVQSVAFFGDEPEQQPVDQPEQGALDLVLVEVVAEAGVGRVLEEAGAERDDRRLAPRRGCRRGSGCRPRSPRCATSPSGTSRRAALVGDLEAGDVQQPVEQDEVLEQLPVEHRLQVDLQVRRPGEGRWSRAGCAAPDRSRRSPTGGLRSGSGTPAPSTAAAARRRRAACPGPGPTRRGGWAGAARRA